MQEGDISSPSDYNAATDVKGDGEWVTDEGRDGAHMGIPEHAQLPSLN